MKNKGFTLIELLVVILIIGILTAIALPQYRSIINKIRLTNAYQIALSLRKAQEIYILTNNTYALDINKLDWSYPSCYTKKPDTSFLYCDDGIYDNIVGGNMEAPGSWRVRLYFTISGNPTTNNADIRLEVYFQKSSHPNEIQCTAITPAGEKLCNKMFS